MEIAAPLLPDVQMMRRSLLSGRRLRRPLLGTDWNEFKQLDLDRVRDCMHQPVIFDGRNIYDPATMKIAWASAIVALGAATTAAKQTEKQQMSRPR